MYNLIACVNKKGLLGQENDLYANSSKDLHYFSQVTKGHNEPKQNIIVMGYNTWLSLPRKPLKDRYNIILTKNHTQEIQDICNFPSLERIFTHIEEIKDNFGEVFIIGGGSVYKQCLENYPDKLNKLYITEIDDDWCGDEYSKYFDYSSVLPRLDIIKERIEPTDTRIYDPQTNTYIVKHVNLTFRVYQKKEIINKDEYKYLELMDTIMKQGLDVQGRNGVTKSSFGEKMVFDLSRFPLLTTKKMGYKTILRELLWFIKGSTDNQELKDKNVHIWDGNASKSFLESRGLSYEQDDLGPIYGFQWRHFGAEYKDRYTDYSGKGYDQLKWLINEIKENPTSRRLILSAWNPAALDEMALPPCHILCQFYVNQKKNTLSCQLYQRSGDMFLGVPFNITSYAFLTYILCKLTGYKPGQFHHILGDAHIYEEHDTSVLLQIKRVPKLFPTLTISDRLTDIDSISEDMFTIENYESYSRISAPMKV
jgi:dihydrofolate reductase/thymidylate synthase